MGVSPPVITAGMLCACKAKPVMRNCSICADGLVGGRKGKLHEGVPALGAELGQQGLQAPLSHFIMSGFPDALLVQGHCQNFLA